MAVDRSWTTALEMQLNAARWLKSRAFQPEADVRVFLRKRPEKATSPELATALLLPMLREAETYIWAEDPMRACQVAARTVPGDVQWTNDLFPLTGAPPDPLPCMWWYFPEGITWPSLGNNKPVPWGLVAGRMVDDTTAPDVTILLLLGVFASLRGDMRLVSLLSWPIEQPLSTVLAPTPEDYATLREDDAFLRGPAAPPPSPEAVEREVALRFALMGDTARFFLAGCAWLQQRIVVTTAGPVERHRRKQLMREHRLTAPPGDVRIVQLRRLEAHHDTAPGPEDVHWSCRWVVSGHWRQQPYKTGRRLRFINPYVKGPDDKPLRVPRRTVYDVSR